MNNHVHPRFAPMLNSISNPATSLVAFMVNDLADRPRLDLSAVADVWMFLRSRGYSHAQLDQHIDEAMKQARALRSSGGR